MTGEGQLSQPEGEEAGDPQTHPESLEPSQQQSVEVKLLYRYLLLCSMTLSTQPRTVSSVLVEQI